MKTSYSSSSNGNDNTDTNDSDGNGISLADLLRLSKQQPTNTSTGNKNRNLHKEQQPSTTAREILTTTTTSIPYQSQTPATSFPTTVYSSNTLSIRKRSRPTDDADTEETTLRTDITPNTPSSTYQLSSTSLPNNFSTSSNNVNAEENDEDNEEMMTLAQLQQRTHSMNRTPNPSVPRSSSLPDTNSVKNTSTALFSSSTTGKRKITKNPVSSSSPSTSPASARRPINYINIRNLKQEYTDGDKNPTRSSRTSSASHSGGGGGGRKSYIAPDFGNRRSRNNKRSTVRSMSRTKQKDDDSYGNDYDDYEEDDEDNFIAPDESDEESDNDNNDNNTSDRSTVSSRSSSSSDELFTHALFDLQRENEEEAQATDEGLGIAYYVESQNIATAGSFQWKTSFEIYCMFLMAALVNPAHTIDVLYNKSACPDARLWTKVRQTVEGTLLGYTRGLASSQAWSSNRSKPFLLESINNLPYYDSQPETSYSGDCEACGRRNHPASYRMKFSGPLIDSQRLNNTKQVWIQSIPRGEYREHHYYVYVGKECHKRIKIYMALQHYKYKLLLSLSRLLRYYVTNDHDKEALSSDFEREKREHYEYRVLDVLKSMLRYNYGIDEDSKETEEWIPATFDTVITNMNYFRNLMENEKSGGSSKKGKSPRSPANTPKGTKKNVSVGTKKGRHTRSSTTDTDEEEEQNTNDHDSSNDDNNDADTNTTDNSDIDLNEWHIETLEERLRTLPLRSMTWSHDEVRRHYLRQISPLITYMALTDPVLRNLVNAEEGDNDDDDEAKGKKSTVPRTIRFPLPSSQISWFRKWTRTYNDELIRPTPIIYKHLNIQENDAPLLPGMPLSVLRNLHSSSSSSSAIKGTKDYLDDIQDSSYATNVISGIHGETNTGVRLPRSIDWEETVSPLFETQRWIQFIAEQSSRLTKLFEYAKSYATDSKGYPENNDNSHSSNGLTIEKYDAPDEESAAGGIMAWLRSDPHERIIGNTNATMLNFVWDDDDDDDDDGNDEEEEDTDNIEAEVQKVRRRRKIMKKQIRSTSDEEEEDDDDDSGTSTNDSLIIIDDKPYNSLAKTVTSTLSVDVPDDDDDDDEGVSLAILQQRKRQQTMLRSPTAVKNIFSPSVIVPTTTSTLSGTVPKSTTTTQRPDCNENGPPTSVLMNLRAPNGSSPVNKNVHISIDGSSDEEESIPLSVLLLRKQNK